MRTSITPIIKSDYTTLLIRQEEEINICSKSKFQFSCLYKYWKSCYFPQRASIRWKWKYMYEKLIEHMLKIFKCTIFVIITLRRHNVWQIVKALSKSIFTYAQQLIGEGNGTPLQYSCLENPVDGGAWWAAVHGVAGSRTWLSDFPFTFHLHALEKEKATHSSILAWRIPGTGEPGGLPSMGSPRVGHDWSDLAAAAVIKLNE